MAPKKNQNPEPKEKPAKKQRVEPAAAAPSSAPAEVDTMNAKHLLKVADDLCVIRSCSVFKHIESLVDRVTHLVCPSNDSNPTSL
jgi:hypothetical protein